MLTMPRGAPTLVLLHAFPLGAEMWAPQREAFPGWRVLAPSFPGFDGVPPAAEPTVAAFATHMLRALDAAGVEQAVFCGLSMGGYVAFELWRLAPGRFAGLVLADTRAGADAPEGRQGRAAMRETLGSEGPSAVADQMLPKLLGAATLEGQPAVVARVRALVLGQTTVGIDGGIQALMTRPDSGDTLATVTVPTLVVVGDEDVLTPPLEAERLAAGIAAARLVRVPAAGHLTNLEQPDAFNRAVSAFLGTLS